jgi:hypothetical protein
MNTIVGELVKTNQRLNEIRDIPLGNLEETLTKRVEQLKKTSCLISFLGFCS